VEPVDSAKDGAKELVVTLIAALGEDNERNGHAVLLQVLFEDEGEQRVAGEAGGVVANERVELPLGGLSKAVREALAGYLVASATHFHVGELSDEGEAVTVAVFADRRLLMLDAKARRSVVRTPIVACRLFHGVLRGNNRGLIYRNSNPLRDLTFFRVRGFTEVDDYDKLISTNRFPVAQEIRR
jgi:hypothetical protein